AQLTDCAGWLDGRLRQAGEFLRLLPQTGTHTRPVVPAAPVSFPFAQPASRPMTETARPAVTPSIAPSDTIRKHRLLELLRGLQGALAEVKWPSWRTILIIAAIIFMIPAAITVGVTATDNSTH